MSIHIINIRYNENKPVTTSRDTQEIPPLIGNEMVRIIKEYNYESSILDDFSFYEKKQEQIIENKNVQVNMNPKNEANNVNVQQYDNNGSYEDEQGQGQGQEQDQEPQDKSEDN